MNNKKPLKIAIGVISVCLLVQVIVSLSGPKFVLNLSSSLPIGVYKIRPFNGSLQRGDTVWITPPQLIGNFIYENGWLPRGWPLLKIAAAIPGDHYEITDTNIAVNNERIGPVFLQDSKGNFLPKIRGRFIVGKNQFLPIATNIEKSFDGRYFGAMPQSNIIAFADPLIVF